LGEASQPIARRTHVSRLSLTVYFRKKAFSR
jgi:hypothetical protein